MYVDARFHIMSVSVSVCACARDVRPELMVGYLDSEVYYLAGTL